MEEAATDDSLRSRRRRRILTEIERIALTLFSERGFHDVTIEEIAAATDISPRTFFRYFGSKLDLVTAGQRRHIEKLREALAKQPPQEPAITALRKAILSAVDALEEDRDSAFLRFKVLTDTPEILVWQMRSEADSPDPLKEMIALRLGTDPATDLRPELIVSTMMSAMHTAHHMWLGSGGKADLTMLVTEALDCVQQGLDAADEPVPARAEASRRRSRA